jgi:hypothetical protein
MDKPTTRLAIPVVLAVGCSLDFVKKRQETALVAGTVLKPADLAGTPRLAVQSRPVGLLVTEATYAASGDTLESVARAIGARVIRIPDEDVDPVLLEARLAAAVRASGRFT